MSDDRVCDLVRAGLDEEYLEVLANEMRVASTLAHPHLIAFKGYYISDTAACCLVFGYEGGGTLQQDVDWRAREGQPFATADVRRWLGQLASALLYMHARRTVHRDVKASNIFLSQDQVGPIRVPSISSSPPHARLLRVPWAIACFPASRLPARSGTRSSATSASPRS